MSKLCKDISHIEAALFDVDGVLSRTTIPVDDDGVPRRTVNVRDGYAIKTAIDKGIVVGIISGGDSEATVKRYSLLGMQHIYMKVKYKEEALRDFVTRTGIPPDKILYVGDDLPDLAVMQLCDFAAAPADAAHEVRAVADYISPIVGGEGVARDILEELLKAKGLWMNEEAFGW